MVNQNDLMEQLGLNPDFIRRDLDACFSSAKYFREMREENENNGAFAATLLRRAAAHSLLVGRDTQERDRLFIDAARAYRDLNMPYSYMLIIFVKQTNSNFLGDEYFFQDQENNANINDVLQQVYLLIASTNRQWNRNWSHITSQLRQDLETYRRKPIGVLGLPISNYLNLFDALRSHTTQDMKMNIDDPDVDHFRTLRQTVQPFLNSYNISLQQTRQNRYHWERLAVPFHPAEIDILSILLYVYKSLDSQNAGEFVKDLINSQLLSDDAKLILNEIIGDYIS